MSLPGQPAKRARFERRRLARKVAGDGARLAPGVHARVDSSATSDHITGGPTVETEGTANSVDPERRTAAAERDEVFNGSMLLVLS